MVIRESRGLDSREIQHVPNPLEGEMLEQILKLLEGSFQPGVMEDASRERKSLQAWERGIYVAQMEEKYGGAFFYDIF